MSWVLNWLSIDQDSLHRRVLHGNNLVVESLKFFVGELILVQDKPVSEHNLQLLRADVRTSVHYLSLVCREICWFCWKLVSMLPINLWHNVLFLLVVLDIVKESDLTNLRRSLSFTHLSLQLLLFLSELLHLVKMSGRHTSHLGLKNEILACLKKSKVLH